jgi:hypothetical protein
MASAGIMEGPVEVAGTRTRVGPPAGEEVETAFDYGTSRRIPRDTQQRRTEMLREASPGPPG